MALTAGNVCPDLVVASAARMRVSAAVKDVGDELHPKSLRRSVAWILSVHYS